MNETFSKNYPFRFTNYFVFGIVSTDDREINMNRHVVSLLFGDDEHFYYNSLDGIFDRASAIDRKYGN